MVGHRELSPLREYVSNNSDFYFGKAIVRNLGRNPNLNDGNDFFIGYLISKIDSKNP